MLLRAILCGSVWKGFLLGKAKKEDVPCRFCGVGMVMVTCFGNVLSSPFSMFVDLPEFADLMTLDRSHWPRCLLWHGWLLGLRGISGKDPWATSFGERCLGAYPVDFAGCWIPLEYWDAADVAWKCLSILIFEQVVAERIYLLSVVLKLLVLVFICLLQNLLVRVRFGERQKSMVMLAWSVAVLLCLFLGL